MMRQRWRFLPFAAALFAVWVVSGAIAQADVTWTLRPGSQQTMVTDINQHFLIPNTFAEYDEAPQAAGSLTSTLSGTYTTTGNFLSAVNFGPFPAFTNFDDDGTAAGLALILAESQTLLHTVAGTTAGDMLPAPGGGTVADPSTPSSVAGVPPSAPANLAWIATDPNAGNSPVWYESLRSTRFGVWTEGSPGATDLTTGNFPLGSGANAQRVVSVSTIDFNTPTFAGGFTNTVLTTDMVPLPVPGNNDTDAPGTDGTISRDGAKYVMTIPFTILFNTLDAELIGGVLELNVFRTITSTTIAEADLTPGDVDFNGLVNIFDVNVISANWSGDSPGAFGNLTPGDANGDGKVNIFDVNLISANWTPTPTPGGGGQAVPEPTTWILFGLGGLLMLAIRRQRR